MKHLIILISAIVFSISANAAGEALSGFSENIFEYVPTSELLVTFYPGNTTNTVQTVTFTSPTRKILLHFNLISSRTSNDYVPITVRATANGSTATGPASDGVYYADKNSSPIQLTVNRSVAGVYNWSFNFRLDQTDFAGDRIEIIGERTGED